MKFEEMTYQQMLCYVERYTDANICHHSLKEKVEELWEMWDTANKDEDDV